jgi:hypothetical protein
VVGDSVVVVAGRVVVVVGSVVVVSVPVDVASVVVDEAVVVEPSVVVDDGACGGEVVAALVDGEVELEAPIETGPSVVEGATEPSERNHTRPPAAPAPTRIPSMVRKLRRVTCGSFTAGDGSIALADRIGFPPSARPH